ncbi:GcrA family cell cycle regulator [Microvirga arabica]|uniref:GcrA family cell cycle regulator n=1 Tax=Microvirga arabica TaxID=1128671 RepID=UPI00361BA882
MSYQDAVSKHPLSVAQHATSAKATERAKMCVIQEPDPRQRTKLLRIGMRQCRYIVSDDPRHAICCGAPTPEGSSWCDWHRKLVYVPVQPIRNRRDALAS